MPKNGGQKFASSIRHIQHASMLVTDMAALSTKTQNFTKMMKLSPISRLNQHHCKPL